MAWTDLFKRFQYATEKDPIAALSEPEKAQAGFSQMATMPDLRNSEGGLPGGFRQTNESIDLTSVQNRKHRYKEYQRLRAIPEVERALEIFADETCVGENTIVETVAHGPKTIRWLCENITDEKFLVYCWNFEQDDFAIGWAHSPRKTKESRVYIITFDDGTEARLTFDHRILMKDRAWKYAEECQVGDEIIAFHRIPPIRRVNKLTLNQFDRVYSEARGWIHERHFIDRWKRGYKDTPEELRASKIIELYAQKLAARDLVDALKSDYRTIEKTIKRYGFTRKECRALGQINVRRRIVSIFESEEPEPVYDLTVEEHHNWCTDYGVVHNCQKDDEDRVFRVHTENREIKEELEFLFFDRSMMDLDHVKIHDKAKNLFLYGDQFEELTINPDKPNAGLTGIYNLPPMSMEIIYTNKGRILEYQQSSTGPDYSAAQSEHFGKSEHHQTGSSNATAVRFHPDQIIHTRLGGESHELAPFGESLIEVARGPAHQLRLMEDSMVVYRLTRSPERRLYFIDTHQLSPARAEAYIERLKDQFKKKKVSNKRGLGIGGASAVEERWHPPAIDEDIWLPIRPNSATRIETLPGACLALDTKIELWNGKFLTLQNLIDQWDRGRMFWVKSCNPKNGRVTPGLVTWAGVTRNQAEVVEIELSNNRSLICTPDHTFPTVSGRKVMARSLRRGHQIFSTNEDEPLTVDCVNKIDDLVDTGTITVDGNEVFHDYHTFSLECGIFTYNSNLGEISDTSYFLDKLYIALNLPKNYRTNEDPTAGQKTLSSQDVKFARFIERLQAPLEKSFYQIADRHLKLRGYPPETYADLRIQMTPPSDYREASRSELLGLRISNASSLMTSGLWSHYDIMTKIFKFTEDEAKDMIARMKMQKVDDLKLQIAASNPSLLGVGVPPSGETQIPAESSESPPRLAPPEEKDPQADQPQPDLPTPDLSQKDGSEEKTGLSFPIPDPSEEELRRFDLEIKQFGKDIDREEIDFSLM